MDRAQMQATNRTNEILKLYSSENYDLSQVYARPLYEALKAFYMEYKTAVGHIITHNAGKLYIDGQYIVTFATPRDTLNKRLARATEGSYYAEERILKRQEEYL